MNSNALQNLSNIQNVTNNPSNLNHKFNWPKFIEK